MSLTLDHGMSAQARLMRFLHLAVRAVDFAFARVYDVVSAEIDRRQTMKLLELDRNMLRDVGLTQCDVAGALEVAPGVKPSTVLAARRRESRSFNRLQTLESRAEMLH